MKVVQICVGRFHHFELARQLHDHGVLQRIYTGYPKWKLRDEGLPSERVISFPWIQTVYMGLMRLQKKWPPLERELAYYSQKCLSKYVAQRLDPCDVLIALSGGGLEAAREQKNHNGKYICDRGSSHIRYQDKILREEYARWGVHYRGIDPRLIDREAEEYTLADRITVPSAFAMRSFVSEGVSATKIAMVPYGVDVRRFGKVGEPDPAKFQILFVGQVSLRKGIPYLLEAFNRFKFSGKQLVIVGSVQPELRAFLAHLGTNVQILGPRPQAELKEWMSRSNVLVLPSIEDGLALVQAQAMACGCPVIASQHTGGEDLFRDGEEGFVVPIRDSTALLEKFEFLASSPHRNKEMGAASLEKVRRLGGSREYGDRYMKVLEGLLRNE